MTAFVSGLGRVTLQVLLALGHHAYFFVDLLRNVPVALRRPYLVVAQVHAIGNRSLVIILSSGLAVGFVPPRKESLVTILLLGSNGLA